MKVVKKNFKLIRDLYFNGKVNVVIANTPEMVDLARRKQAEIYLRYGNVEKRQIVDGLLDEETDPYYKVSVYFLAFKNGKYLASSRIIMSGKLATLQIAEKLDVKDLKAKYQGVEDSSVEISGLVKERGVSSVIPLLLYAEILRFCRENSVRYIFASSTREPFKKLEKILGVNLIAIGNPYRIDVGNNIVHPFMINVDNIQSEDGTGKGVERFLLKRMRRLIIN